MPEKHKNAADILVGAFWQAHRGMTNVTITIWTYCLLITYQKVDGIAMMSNVNSDKDNTWKILIHLYFIERTLLHLWLIISCTVTWVWFCMLQQFWECNIPEGCPICKMFTQTGNESAIYMESKLKSVKVSCSGWKGAQDFLIKCKLRFKILLCTFTL